MNDVERYDPRRVELYQRARGEVLSRRNPELAKAAASRIQMNTVWDLASIATDRVADLERFIARRVEPGSAAELAAYRFLAVAGLTAEEIIYRQRY